MIESNNHSLHLLSVAALPAPDFQHLLDRALKIRSLLDHGKAVPNVMAGKLLFNLFFENSTRTTLSFEVAGKRLGAFVSRVPIVTSSISKGESLEDTVLTLCAQGADVLVIRASAPNTMARALGAINKDGYSTAIVNAGEGALGHPTQGLLDAATLLRALGRTAADGLADQTITICGDIKHSRVAASAIEAFSRLGATLRLVCPPSLMPDTDKIGDAVLTPNLDEALEGANVVMALRLQKERMMDGADGAYSIGMDEAAYHSQYGLSHDRMSHAKPNALVMHPGPMNRGVEITSTLADDLSVSLIRSQVTQGVALRIAVLEWLCESTSL